MPGATLSQQIAAVEIARRIVQGSTKPPRAGGSESLLLAAQLTAAADTIGAVQQKEPR